MKFLFRQWVVSNAGVIFLFFLAIFFGCNRKTDKPSEEGNVKEAIQALSFNVINSYPHDTNSFTEGFLFHDGKLFESTGATQRLIQTRSLFGIVDLKTGKIDVKAELDRNKYFGEGITFLNGKIYQLTYDTKIGFIYDAYSLTRIGSFTFPGKEGWGLTTDGKDLIMSDGTNTLTFLNPESLQPVRSLGVAENGYAVDYLNELEYHDGFIFANIWMTNRIVKIDPVLGHVIASVDLTSLANEAKTIYPGSLEMNGIAIDSLGNFFVTGKMWPKVYEIKVW